MKRLTQIFGAILLSSTAALGGSPSDKSFDSSELQDQLGPWAEPLKKAAELACDHQKLSKMPPFQAQFSLETKTLKFVRLETKSYSDNEVLIHLTQNQAIQVVITLSRLFMGSDEVSVRVSLGGKKYLRLLVNESKNSCVIQLINRTLYLSDNPKDERVWKEERMLPGGYQSVTVYNPPPLALEHVAATPLPVSSTEPTVTIAIMDSGFDYNHPALIHKFDRNNIGHDFVDNDELPYEAPGPFDLTLEDAISHGTAVAGIAGQGSDYIRLLPIRINFHISREGKELREAIAYASQRGARIVNMSFGMKSELGIQELKKGMMEHPEILFVTASGNDKTDQEEIHDYPTAWRLTNLISVAATDKEGQLATWGKKGGSVWGATSVHLAALGKDVETTNKGGSTVTCSGTSLSAPLVANIAAKILLINPKLSPRQVIAILGAATHVTSGMRDKLRFGGELSEKRALEITRRTLSSP